MSYTCMLLTVQRGIDGVVDASYEFEDRHGQKSFQRNGLVSRGYHDRLIETIKQFILSA